MNSYIKKVLSFFLYYSGILQLIFKYTLNKKNIRVINYHCTPLNFQENFIKQLQFYKKYFTNINIDDLNKYITVKDYNLNIFENIKTNLNNIMTELFVISNNLEKDHTKINKELKILNIDIEKEKINNAKLKNTLVNLINKYNSSDIMIDDYKQIYNINYLKNFTVLVGIICTCILLII
jgi:type II secretory ATPase GspE/PulE/Tfp pilus assembly ATPase PilB-like protein